MTRLPQPTLMFVSCGIAFVTAIGSVAVATVRLRQGRSVQFVISLTRVIASATGITCVVSLIAQVSMILYMQGSTVPSPAQAQLTAIGLSRVLSLLNVSICVCGVNALIAFALNQKWKEPQSGRRGLTQ